MALPLARSERANIMGDSGQQSLASPAWFRGDRLPARRCLPEVRGLREDREVAEHGCGACGKRDSDEVCLDQVGSRVWV